MREGSLTYTYFDEEYFQNGAAKGTAYYDYLSAAPKSKIYREIAEFVSTVIRPKRALEIGCATGIIVRYLNEAGIETHGVDVSEWAIANREHPNAVLSPAESLPFPDDHFDFILSVHALEHIPPQFKDAVFAEIRRVGSSSLQFHMMPIIGLGPYAGDPEAMRSALRKDPTHSLLEDRAWWAEEFRKIGFNQIPIGVHFANDHPSIDLGDSQIFIGAREPSKDISERIRTWNVGVTRTLSGGLAAATAGIYRSVSSRNLPTLYLRGKWGDIEIDGGPEMLTAETQFVALVVVRAASPVWLRFCFFSHDGAEADFGREFPPGTTTLCFSGADLYQRVGSALGGPVKKILFGGSAEEAGILLLLSSS